MDKLPEGAIPEEEFQSGSTEMPEGAIHEDAFHAQNAQLPESAIPEFGKLPEAPQTDMSQYTTPGQKTLAATEAAAQGATFGLSNLAETGLGLTTEADIYNREQANPGLHAVAGITGTVGSMLVPGVGEGW